MKLVSVIIPYFKKVDFIDKCINSVLDQSYRKLEILIVYDDSDEKDLKYIKKYRLKDKRIRIIKNKKNLGAGESRNVGIKKSKGELIAFLDADDYWKKNKINEQIKFMKKNLAKFVHSSYYVVDKKNQIIGNRISPNVINYTDLLNSCDIGLSTVLVEKNIIKNKHFPKLKTKEDYVLWLKISKDKIKLFGMKEKLSYWRNLDNSLSSSSFQKIIDGYRVYRIYLKKSILTSVFRLIILSLNFFKKKYK